MSECKLLVGGPALAAQAVLAAISLSVLYIKRLREYPQRPPLIWSLDVSKQIFGMLAAHISGMLVAIILHSVTATQASECSWYFIAFTFDTTLGVALTLTLHRLILKYLEKQIEHVSDRSHAVDGVVSWQVAIVACGKYGDPPSLRLWGYQSVEWALCVVIARAFCGMVITLASPLLLIIAVSLDTLFYGHPTVLLYFVMICCPLTMNAAQLLVQDACLKYKQQRGHGEDVTIGLGPLQYEQTALYREV